MNKFSQCGNVIELQTLQDSLSFRPFSKTLTLKRKPSTDSILCGPSLLEIDVETQDFV